MLNEEIILDEPTEIVSVKDMDTVDVKPSGEFIFTIANNTLSEGKTPKKLKDGTMGLVKYISVTGEAKDLRTKASVGKLNLKFFLNTKGSFMASDLAAVTGCYDPVLKKSKFVPEERHFKDGSTIYTVPDLIGKSFVVGVVRAEDYEKPDGTVIPQYDCVAILAEIGVNARHFVTGRVDPETRKADYQAFRGRIERAIEAKREREEQLSTQAYGAGAGVQPLQNPYIFTQDAQVVTQTATQSTATGEEIPF